MTEFNRKDHWEKIYGTKSLNEVSWYQSVPSTSLEMVRFFNLPKDASIIDVGGGDSFLVDHLLEMGYTAITVLDISEKAIDRAKARLSDKANKVSWIIADAATFIPTERYDFWHDRAAFHFLTNEAEISHYIEAIDTGLKTSGKLVLGTFSENGPTKCSGIQIKQYSESSMTMMFKSRFEKIKCFTIDHKTPFSTTQNFLFCSFKKIEDK
jgi:SAM-dependent methyltransferase